MKVLKCLVVFAVVAGLCATAVAVEPPHSTMKKESTNQQYIQTDPPGPPMYFSDSCPADPVHCVPPVVPPPADPGNCCVIDGDTSLSANDYENDGPDCSYGSGGNDEIFELTVGTSGLWQIDTMCVGWDTSIMVREETGGGCPGDFLACDGDGGHGTCGAYESAMQLYLFSGETYYVIVDGWSTYTNGAFGLNVCLIQILCEDDSDCDDGEFCNGEEWCDPAGACQPGTSPCASYQTCDEDYDVCVDPYPCITWQGGVGSNYYFPYVSFSPNCWLADDVELERGCTNPQGAGLSGWYEINIIARALQNPVGSPYFLDTALYTVEALSCLPLAQIDGSQCSQLAGTIDAGGSPADIFHCDGTAILPDNSGDFDRCEIDFFMGYVGGDLGVGFGIAGGPQIIGGLAADDDFGVSVFFLEVGGPGSNIWDASWFGDEANTPADFEGALVCTHNIGVCCVYYDDGSHDCIPDMTVDDCLAFNGQPGVTIAVWHECLFWDPVSCEDPDADGFFDICGDNCPGVYNPEQYDCDNGITPEGDACETDPDYADDDGDHVCNKDDNCPNDPNPFQEDMDGDGMVVGVRCGGDVCDVCPQDHCNNDDRDQDTLCNSDEDCPDDGCKSVPGECGCGVGPMVMPCQGAGAPGFDDELDTDGDGVPDCNDQCPGVDDAVFPGCQGAIPTVSEWGLVILALLLLVGAKVYFGRRAATS